MLKKLKRSFICFMCTVLLVTNISMTAYKPLKVNATGLEVAILSGATYEAIIVLLDLIAAGLVCCGAYNLYEDDERFAQVVDEYIGSVTDVGRVWGDTGDTTGTFVRDPNTGQWVQNPDTIPWNDKPQVLTPEEQQKYGLPTNYYPTGKDLIADVWKYRNSGGGGGGNGGGSDSGGESGSNNTVYEAIVGSAVVASIGSFLGDLFSGEVDTSDSPALNEWLNSNMNNIIYTGELEKIDGQVLITVSTTYNYTNNYVVSSSYGSGAFVGERFAIYSDYSNGNYYSSYGLRGKDSNGNWIDPTFYGVVTTNYWADGSVKGTSTGTWKHGNIGYATTISANIPIFATKEDFSNYLDTGDDSAAINKEKPKFTMLDMKGMSANLPTTLAPLTSGKAVTDKALKDFINGMTDYKNTTDPESLTDPDTHTKKAEETIQKSVDDNEAKEDTQPKPEPAPLPVIPNPDKITIDGSEATRDWRLVFPFCIPFDIIDLIRVFQAEPEAPRFEIPLKVEEYRIDYTFVLDLAPFESLAVIFRLFERIMFILGLAVLTGKVIKW